jgi:predicted molibdopterin-dependent oxidoreductase YjgC
MGVHPGEGGMDADAMLRQVKALLVVGDNPAMFARGEEAASALAALDCLVTIDSLQTDTVKASHFAFADLPAYGKEGTFTNADHRIGKLNPAETPTGDQKDCLSILHSLGTAVAERLNKAASLPGPSARDVMSEIASSVPGYGDAGYDRLESGVTRALGTSPTAAQVQGGQIVEAAAANGQLVLTTARTLYTSLEGASIRSPEADKLHREEFLEINPLDAMALGIGQNRPVIVQNGGREYTFSAALTDAVAQGSVFLPLYLEGGAVNALLHHDGTGVQTVTVRPA